MRKGESEEEKWNEEEEREMSKMRKR